MSRASDHGGKCHSQPSPLPLALARHSNLLAALSLPFRVGSLSYLVVLTVGY
ncbi:hypothetical protein E2C01_089064 [Portunus trituberculatus]|uniref:Uncharacterized protein n=1 Tax=Portunus trituberculatus TaxID=210409 RepID=A0A5B7JL80_PORTR|nr:hypothetical protein [Portunus trituberculatus]